MTLPVVDHLPEELLSEILQKLPAKFLIQVKSVCKLWSNQVSNRHFARSHLVHYHHQQHSADEQVIIIERSCLQPYKHDYYCIKVVQDIKDVQEEKQFKIYCKIKDFFMKDQEGETTEWQEFDTGYKNSDIMSTQSLTLVNKEYHWLRFQDNGTVRFEPYLYSMNAGTEEIKFRETKISSEITCSFGHNSLLEIKGSLCLTDSVSNNFNQINIWTLHDKDEYNRQWTKTQSIVLDSEFKTSPHVYSFPCSYQRQTVILIQYKNLLLFYDLEKKESRNFDFPIDHFSQIEIPRQ
ncbi:hypothetical protein FRX31_030745 [Thalictrum thalictroides]|uniref:F-box domain-containing protein n=1 Tax=Thalictrum thalictroides TaxID=46969 RepID=A0A7J6V431_THATH|nr:hypothetical protein FRX31_030745 [Thalictrum thalictroides]